MGRAFRVPFLCAVAVLAGTACAGAPHGSDGQDAAQIRRDVARRTNSAPAEPGDDGCEAAVSSLLAIPLSPDGAVKIALLNNATVREKFERLGIARADLVQAGLISNPVFSGHVKWFSSTPPEVELSLAQSFLDLFFIPLRRRVAAADLCATQAEIARELVALTYDVRRAFVSVQAAVVVVAVREEVVRSATTSRDLMKGLQEAGSVVDADLIAEELALSRAHLEVTAAHGAMRDAREPINVLLGFADGSRWTIVSPLPDLPSRLPEVEGAESRAVAASLDLIENGARIQSAMVAAGLAGPEQAWSQRDLGVSATREPSGAWGVGPGLSTSIPIFDLGQAKRMGANAVLRQRIEHQTALTVEVRSAARRFADRAAVLAERARYLRETYVPLWQRSVLEVVKNYNAMQIGAFQVLDAKQREVDARRESVEVQRDAWIAVLDLQQLLAGSLDRSRLELRSAPKATERSTSMKGH